MVQSSLVLECFQKEILSGCKIEMLGSCPPEKKKKIEKNKRTNANRDPDKRNPHFSLTVEVKKEEEDRLENIRSRLNAAKSVLGIDRKTSSTQNADLLEALLRYFELVKPSAFGDSPSIASSTRPPDQPQVHPPPNESSEHRRPRKRQVYVDAAVDDPFFVCSGESLKALVKYFTGNPQCEFCGDDYNLFGMKFSKQGHVCRMEVPCVANDSVVWLSSGILGHPAKYVANVR